MTFRQGFTKFTINFRKDYFGSNKLFTNDIRIVKADKVTDYNYLYHLSNLISTKINQYQNLQDKLIQFLLIMFNILNFGILIPNTVDEN